MDKNIFVTRIIRDDLAVTFKFEVLYRETLVLTDGVSYNSLEVCLNSLSQYLLQLYNYKQQPLPVDLFSFISNNKDNKIY